MNIPFETRYDHIVGALLFIVLIGFIAILGYPGNDDKFITYFVADAVASGQGLVNVNGDLVEQSSSLLFTYLLALGVLISGSIAAEIGYFVSLGFLAICLWPLVRILARYGVHWGYAIVILCSPPVLFWAASGMENSLYLFLILALVCFAGWAEGGVHRLAVIALLGAAITLTRPEGIAVVLAMMFFYLVTCRTARASLVSLAGIAGGLGAIGLRVGVGLAVFPLPVYSKMAAAMPSKIGQGIGYIIYTSELLPIYVWMILGGGILAAVVAIWRRGGENRGTTIMILGALAATLGFAIVSGGDWMPFGRFLTVPFVVAGLLIIVWAPGSSRPVIGALMLTMSGFAMAAIVVSSQSASPFFAKNTAQAAHFEHAWPDRNNRIHSRDILFIDDLLVAIEANPKQHLNIASIQMGMVPYYLQKNTTKELRFFDFLGLVTDDIHKCDFVKDPFGQRPYDRLGQIEACFGHKFDYIYDLSRYDYAARTREFGCSMVFEKKYNIQSSEERMPFRPIVFLADCTNRVAAQ